jgi:hypothetical protein
VPIRSNGLSEEPSPQPAVAAVVASNSSATPMDADDESTEAPAGVPTEAGGEFSVLASEAQQSAKAESEPELVPPPPPLDNDMRITRTQRDNAILSLLGPAGRSLCTRGDREAGAAFLQEAHRMCVGAIDILSDTGLHKLADLADQVLAKQLLLSVGPQCPSSLCAPSQQLGQWPKQVATPVFSTVLATELPLDNTTLIWVLPYDSVTESVPEGGSWRWYAVTDAVARVLLAIEGVAWLGHRLETLSTGGDIVAQLGQLYASTAKQYCTVLAHYLSATQAMVDAHLTPEALREATAPFFGR